MLHRLLQAALRMNKISEAVLKEAAKTIVTLHSSDILSLGEDENWAMGELTESIPSMVKWVHTFLRPQPTAAGKLDSGSRDPPRAACIAEVLDIEESIWSPRLGLKGMVDVSVRARVTPKKSLGVPGTGQEAQSKGKKWQDSLNACNEREPLGPLRESSGNRASKKKEKERGSPASEALEDLIMALELKTGKKTEGQANVDHRAQLMLYSLLMSERYEVPIRTGLLLYLHTGQTLGVEAGRRELVGLIIRRNCHAAALADASSADPARRRLPPVLQNSIVCGSCNMRDVCKAYAKAEQVADGEHGSSQQHHVCLPGAEDAADSPMTAEQAKFLQHWERLVDLEAAQMEASLHEMWSMPAAEREAKGRGIASLELVLDLQEAEQSANKENTPTEEHTDNKPEDAPKGGVLGDLTRHRKQRKLSSSASKQAKGSVHKVHVSEAQSEAECTLWHFRRRQSWFPRSCRPSSRALQEEAQQRCASERGEEEQNNENGGPAHAQQDLNPGGAFTDLPFACGDHVVLSTEGGQVGVATGIVASITPGLISVRTSSPLRIRSGCLPSKADSPIAVRASRITWRIDRSESLGIMASMRMNLASLFLPSAQAGDSQASRLMQLVVDLKTPEESIITPQDKAIEYLEGLSSREVNDDQREAISKVLRSSDYTLIQGLPGCGKTSTIVHLVKALLARGNNSILLAAYTNTAVDNMLLKLLKEGVDVVRIGRQDAVHPSLRTRTYGDQPPNPMSVSQLKYNLAEARVVGVTCLGVSHPVFALRRFDICIVDEACQVTLPVCLGPLRFATSFVLVGDPQQLPPLVRSKKAREHGLSETLFHRLAQAHPPAVISLATQYRMNESIMALSNAIVYGGKLKCASDSVRNARLELPWLNAQNKRPHSHRGGLGSLPGWLREALDPKASAAFLSTDMLAGCEEQKVGDALFNPVENDLTVGVVHALLASGVASCQLAVLTPYNAQVKLLRASLEALSAATGALRGQASGKESNAFSPPHSPRDVEVETIDRFQGKDADCIILSAVRSNESGVVGQLLSDVARVNVAITRAKRKLIIFGSAKTLRQGSVPCRDLLQMMAERGWVVQLPVVAAEEIAEFSRTFI